MKSHNTDTETQGPMPIIAPKKREMDPYLNKCLTLFIWFLSLLLFTAQGFYAYASAVEDDNYTRSTLRGLDGVYVAVEPPGHAVEAQGFTAATLRTDMEVKLRAAGIKVLSKRQWTETEGAPVCYLVLNVVNDVALEKVAGFTLYAYEVRVELNQDVILVRDRAAKALSPTWSSSYLGVTNSLPRIKAKVREMMDRFIDAYLDANHTEDSDPGAGAQR